MRVINFTEERSVIQTNYIYLNEERFNDNEDNFSNFIKKNYNVKTFDELIEKLNIGDLDASEIIVDYANTFNEDRDAFDDVEYDDGESNVSFEVINNDNL